MKREWKPGDVAHVTCHDGCSFRAVKDEKGWGAVLPGIGWVADSDVNDARPLVVLDPEDREQIETFAAAFKAASVEHNSDDSFFANCTTAALRSLVTPPKFDEPEAFGAVVEGADGARWVLGAKGWTNLDAPGMYLNWAPWSDVNDASPVVRVLSDGVQP